MQNIENTIFSYLRFLFCIQISVNLLFESCRLKYRHYSGIARISGKNKYRNRGKVTVYVKTIIKLKKGIIS